MSLIGLALGGGSARGFAHIGVLQVLEENGITVDMIAGTSIGSVFGAIYLSGCDLYLLGKLAKEFNQIDYLDLVPPRMGLIKGDKVEALIKLLTKNYTFEQLAKPFYVVAVDVETGERAVLDSGSVAEAVRASIAIPGIFTPKKIGARLLVDGGVLDIIPIDVLRERGASKVIAVDVRFGGYQGHSFKIRNVFDVVLQTEELAKRVVVEQVKKDADVFIQPNLARFNPADFARAWQTIEIGRAATLEVLDDLKSLSRV